jgi:hypothetical protein
MKRTVALALLGMAAVTTAMGQGHVIVANYVSPYNSQITWGATTGNSGPVVAADGLQFQVYYGAGTIVDESLLTAGITVGIDPGKTYNGGGWFVGTIQVLPAWASGETYTFQLRALDGTTPNGPIDTALSRSALWTESSSIVSTANPANLNLNGKGLVVEAVVPEPTTFALAGLGAAALLIFRRRD